jgi:ArsR family transcriptional regulator
MLDRDEFDYYISVQQYSEVIYMKEFIKVMKALSDPNRVKLLKILQQKELCVCEIRAALGIAQPTVSKHLKVLESAGLVGRRKEGLWVNYTLTGGGSPYAAALLGNLKYWLSEDEEIRAMAEKISAIKREEICRKT